jgi:hypothetical protein
MKVTVCQLDNRTGYLDAMLVELRAHIQANASDFPLPAAEILIQRPTSRTPASRTRRTSWRSERK